MLIKWIKGFRYKAVHNMVYPQKWSDVPTDFVSIIFLENGHGKRKVDLGGYRHADLIKNSAWWAKYATPWLNHLPLPSKSKKDNVVPLRLVKNDD